LLNIDVIGNEEVEVKQVKLCHSNIDRQNTNLSKRTLTIFL